jgi:hypothetical protein
MNTKPAYHDPSPDELSVLDFLGRRGRRQTRSAIDGAVHLGADLDGVISSLQVAGYIQRVDAPSMFEEETRWQITIEGARARYASSLVDMYSEDVPA